MAMADATVDSESLEVAMGLELPIYRSMLKNSQRRFKFRAILKSTKDREQEQVFINRQRVSPCRAVSQTSQ